MAGLDITSISEAIHALGLPDGGGRPGGETVIKAEIESGHHTGQRRQKFFADLHTLADRLHRTVVISGSGQHADRALAANHQALVSIAQKDYAAAVASLTTSIDASEQLVTKYVRGILNIYLSNFESAVKDLTYVTSNVTSLPASAGTTAAAFNACGFARLCLYLSNSHRVELEGAFRDFSTAIANSALFPRAVYFLNRAVARCLRSDSAAAELAAAEADVKQAYAVSLRRTAQQTLLQLAIARARNDTTSAALNTTQLQQQDAALAARYQKDGLKCLLPTPTDLDQTPPVQIDLDDDVWLLILGRISPQDVLNCSLVCKTWLNTTSVSSADLWHQIYIRQYGDVDAPAASCSAVEIKRQFVKRMQEGVRWDPKMTFRTFVSDDGVTAEADSLGSYFDMEEHCFATRGYGAGHHYWEFTTGSRFPTLGPWGLIGVTASHVLPPPQVDSNSPVVAPKHPDYFLLCSYKENTQLEHMGETYTGRGTPFPSHPEDVVGVELDLTASPPLLTFHLFVPRRKLHGELMYELPVGKTWWPYISLSGYTPELTVHKQSKESGVRLRTPVTNRCIWRLNGEKEALLECEPMVLTPVVMAKQRNVQPLFGYG